MADEPQPAAVQPPEASGHRRAAAAGAGLCASARCSSAIVVGLLVSVLTVDLGPRLRERAEREGSKYLQRPLRIGRLSARLIPGVFVVEDLVIEGLTPQDRPFLTAKMITVRVPWWTVFTRKLIDRVGRHDRLADGGRDVSRTTATTFPSSRATRQNRGPSRFTTTLRSVTASRGQFTYDDHATPWTTVARNLNVSLYRSFATNDYRGRASFSNGTITIQSYEPFRADMQSRFRLDGSQGPLRSHRSHQRRCAVGDGRRRRSGALAGADL